MQAVPLMTDTEVKEVIKTIPKPDTGMPHSILEVYDEYGENNFKHIVTVGQHLFEQFASTTTGEYARSLLKIFTHLNMSQKKAHEILTGERYAGGNLIFPDTMI